MPRKANPVEDLEQSLDDELVPTDEAVEDGPEEDDEDLEDDEPTEEEDASFSKWCEDNPPSPELHAMRAASDVKPDAVVEQIAEVQYFELPNSMGWLCQITMKNGFHFADASYNIAYREMADDSFKEKAYERAFRKAHQFEAYAAADRTYREKASEP